MSTNQNRKRAQDAAAASAGMRRQLRGLAGEEPMVSVPSGAYRVAEPLATVHLATDSATRNAFLREQLRHPPMHAAPTGPVRRVGIAFRVPESALEAWNLELDEYGNTRGERRNQWVSAALEKLEVAMRLDQAHQLTAAEVGPGLKEEAWTAGPDRLVHRALARKTSLSGPWLERPAIVGNTAGRPLRVTAIPPLWELRDAGKPTALFAAADPYEAVRTALSGTWPEADHALLSADLYRKR